MSRPEMPAESGTASRGVVFTPADLAGRLARGLPGGLDRPLLDPACGAGALLLAAREELGDRPAHLHGLEIDPELAGSARTALGPHCAEVRCVDAVEEGTPWPAGTAILANPPWLSFSGRQRADRPAGGLGRVSGWPSLQSVFLARIAEHVAKEGTSARVILPAAVVEGSAYGELRRAVTTSTRLDRAPEELGEHAFPGVTEPAVIVTLVPGDGSPGSDAPWTAVSAWRSALEAALDAHPRLAPTVFGDPGVHTGNCSADLVSSDAEAASGRWSPLRQGRDLAAFDLGSPTASLRIDLSRTPERRFRIAALEHYQAFPILIRQTADRPIAALHVRPGYFRNSLLASRGAPGLDPAFIVAVLNGPVAVAWHRTGFLDARQRAFPQVKVAHLRSQPFPFETRASAPARHDEIAARVRALRPGTADFESQRDEVDSLALRSFGLPPELEQEIRSVAERPTRE